MNVIVPRHRSSCSAWLELGPVEVLSQAYADRMVRKHRWNAPLMFSPSAWDLRRLDPGYMLDVGCGIGRQLMFNGGHGIGVDPNLGCVEVARKSGLNVVTPEDFAADQASFDSILIAHVLEHISDCEAVALLAKYLPYLKLGGQVILLTPQEKGFASDPTHLRFVDLSNLRKLAIGAGLNVTRAYSFPFPRWAGKMFVGNEFRLTARKV